jgi:hypothetical protein
MVANDSNPSTCETWDHKFEASLINTERPCLTKNKVRQKVTHWHTTISPITWQARTGRLLDQPGNTGRHTHTKHSHNKVREETQGTQTMWLGRSQEHFRASMATGPQRVSKRLQGAGAGAMSFTWSIPHLSVSAFPPSTPFQRQPGLALTCLILRRGTLLHKVRGSVPSLAEPPHQKVSRPSCALALPPTFWSVTFKQSYLN